jgi:hypothetical protein
MSNDGIILPFLDFKFNLNTVPVTRQLVFDIRLFALVRPPRSQDVALRSLVE